MCNVQNVRLAQTLFEKSFVVEQRKKDNYGIEGDRY